MGPGALGRGLPFNVESPRRRHDRVGRAAAGRLDAGHATLVSLHRSFDGLSERTALGSVSRNETLERTAGFDPTPPTCAAQQIGSYLGYSGRGANTFGKAARDPNRKSLLTSARLL